MPRLTFPTNFRWGSATASYQVEGGVHEGGRQPTIWDTFSHTPGRIKNGDTGDVACDHYHRFAEDVKLMAALHLNSYRFSLAWGRIVDAAGRPNPVGLDFYSRLVDVLLEHGITPQVTLYHWDLPEYLAGGWLNRDTAFRFAEYAAIAGKHLGDRVTYWTTLNEPWCSAFLGYAEGQHAPGHTDPGEALRAAHHLNLAHGLGVQALRSSVPQADISVVCNLHALKPASDSPADRAACARLQRVGNDIWTGPMLDGRYPDAVFEDTAAYSDWSFLQAGDLDLIHQPLDSFGINYYTSTLVRDDAMTLSQRQVAGLAPNCWVADHVACLPPTGPLTTMGWGLDPSALTDLLTDFHSRWPMPVIVSENGAAYPDVLTPDGHIHDQARVDYLDSHLRAVHAAISAGVDVRGYYAWSLMDNFEWAHGYTQRFGLAYVDFATQQRLPKDSFHWYASVIDAGGLD